MINTNQNIIPKTQYSVTFDQMNIITNFQRKWTHIASWTRAFLQATIYDLPTLKVVSDKLLGLPQEFYDLFSHFYGTQNAQEFVRLLSNCVMSGMSALKGMRNGDQELANTSTAQWYKNSDELASFLAKIEIYWDENTWKDFLYQYIKLTTDEMIAQMGGNYEQEMAIFQRLEDLSVQMGSYMSRGIIASNKK